ncbi:hypothetical protein NET02_08880 [Thermomicrobiaceae bacterium CFH 74404]|uniref:Uncharacterized protein n=1 Tax=Thermalbibacter longus TaxID=2951981 RepID=A0AA41WDT0_9BACT|nr:hypothetical protein [Thermalbibacter longus]MCM8749258.1 hypothetical protein [Thermalbibacter longus]
MVVYRPKRRFPLWAKGAIVLAALLLLAGAGLWVRSATRPSAEERLAQAVASMMAQLDVLRISHYTPDVVRDGQVVMQTEYQAALADIERVRGEWQSVRGEVPEPERAQVDRAIEELRMLIEARRPPAEVDQRASELIELLRGLRVHP